jgi:hypothetical protein
MYRLTVVIEIVLIVSREGGRRSRQHVATVVTQNDLGRCFGYGTDSMPGRGNYFFFWNFRSSPGPTQPPINAHRDFFFSRIKCSREASLIINIQLGQRLRESDIIRPLHHMPTWNEQGQLLTREIFLCSKSLITVINKSGTH